MRTFLQERVGRFGLWGSSFGWFFLAFRGVDVLRGGQELDVSMAYHFLAATSLLSIWVICLFGQRSAAMLRAIEAGALVAACTFYALMGGSLPAYGMPHYIVILALSFGLITRAIYVPSSAKFTALLTTLCGIPMLIVTYRIYVEIDLPLWFGLAPELKDATPKSLAINMTVFAAAWWLCAIGVCAGGSRVIYGLRKEVRDVRRLGQYTLVEKIGAGGMGVVYRAKHAMLRRPTAIKLLPADKAGERSLARFEKEVQLTALLTHPNTVTVFDYGRTPDNIFYYAMELLDGATLASVVEVGGRQSAARTIHILDQAAGALAEAHAIGLIHRDVKPANLMLVEQGGNADVTKVLDFGLVKELEPLQPDSVTHADSLTGTPQYIAPESITAPDSVDARSDLYALAAVGYFLITGEHVFGGSTLVEVCSNHLHSEPIPPSTRANISIDPRLEKLLLACLAKKPAERPQTANAFREQIAECKAYGGWSQQDARAWWATNEKAVTAHQLEALQESATGNRLTLDIDLERRRTSA